MTCNIEQLRKQLQELQQIANNFQECHSNPPDNGKIQEALDLIMRYGGIDGAHHKQWVLDQVVRILADNYAEWVKEAKDGEDGANTYSWDEGIAP